MRRTWHLLEVLHAVVYFAAETRPRYESLGLTGFWRGYFASRSAPLGLVGPDLVTSCFHSFSREMVARAVPDVWTITSPELAQQARLAVMDDALRRIWGETLDSATVYETTDLVTRALAAGSPSGRPMFEACMRQKWPEAQHLRLFWGVTSLREFRGDGHIAVLRAKNLNGAEANRLMRAVGRVPAEQQRLRGWSDDQWAAATLSLQDRGVLTRAGDVTATGRRLIEDNERATDELANVSLLALDYRQRERLNNGLKLLVQPILATGLLPFPNPMALPRVR